MIKLKKTRVKKNKWFNTLHYVCGLNISFLTLKNIKMNEDADTLDGIF